MILSFLSLALKYKNYIGYTLAALALCVLVYQVHTSIYNQGFNAAKETYEERLRASEKLLHAKDKASAEISQQTVVRYLTKTVEIEKKVPVYVETIKNVIRDAECVFPDDVYRLHDEAIRIANGDASP